MKKGIAIIPARKGSKRLPNKNLLNLGGKPLVQYTLEAVVGSECFEEVLLSSDSEEILAIGEFVQGVTPDKREDALAGDKVKVIDLVQSIAHRPGYREQYERIGLFLPTCPFRTAKQIKDGLELLTTDDFSVVSVKKFDDPVQLSCTIGPDNIMNPEAILKPSPLVTGETRSQDFETIYKVNGGFYIAWLDKFFENDNFFHGRVKAYLMDSLHSVDIDYKVDLEWAEFLLANHYISI